MIKPSIFAMYLIIIPILLEPKAHGIDNNVILQQQQQQKSTNPVNAVFDRLNSSEKEARRREKSKKDSSRVTCLLDSLGTSIPCSNLTFIILDSQKQESQRVHTNELGECTFVLASNDTYTVAPASKHYELEPPGHVKIKKGEHVTIHLRTQ